MKKFAAAVFALLALSLMRTAWAAGPLEDARNIDQRFDNAILACKPDAALQLFEPGAMAIFPGQGEMEAGQKAIGRLVDNFSKAFCPDELKAASLRNASFAATPLGPDYMIIVRVIDATDRNGARAQFRATELIHQVKGQWYYLVDHVSVGLAPASASDKP